jgi:hypothetical protein
VYRKEKPVEEPTTWAQLKEWTATANRTELRLACKELGISTSGTKADLRDRIMNVADVNDPNAPAAYQPSNPTLLSAQAEEDEEEVMGNDPFVTHSDLDRLLTDSQRGFVSQDQLQSYKVEAKTDLDKILESSAASLVQEFEGQLDEIDAILCKQDEINSSFDQRITQNASDIVKLTQVGDNNVRRIIEVDNRVSQIDSRQNGFFSRLVTGRLLAFVIGLAISFIVGLVAVNNGWFDNIYFTNQDIVIAFAIIGALVFANMLGDAFSALLSRSSPNGFMRGWKKGREEGKRDAK